MKKIFMQCSPQTSYDVFPFYSFRRGSLILMFNMVLFASILHFFQVQAAAQTDQEHKGSCERINKDIPPIFLSYDRLIENGSPGKPENNIMVSLRLKNNLTCPIIVLVGIQDNFEFVKNTQGGLVMRHTNVLKADSEVFLIYELHHNSNSKVPILVSGDQLYSRKLEGGQSITFRVPLRNFKEGYDIGVPFGYEWEDRISVGTEDLEHRAYFRAKKLPDKLK